MPFFSVIIPTYNRANLLRQTIASVQAQSFEDWECIVIDDGSTDNTKELVNKIADKDARIKYFYQNNAERSAARNKGIKKAIGKYICFLDSDDKYLANHLEILNTKIVSKHFKKALFFTNYLASENGKIIHPNIPKLTGKPIIYLLENAIIPGRVCIHRDILEKELFDKDISIVEDVILWVRIADKFPVIHIEQNTVLYSLHDDNSINIKGNGATKRLNGLKLFFKRYPSIKAKIPNSVQNELLSNTLFNVAKHYIYNNKTLLAIKTLLASIIKKPIHQQTKHKVYLITQLIRGKQPEEYSPVK